MVAAAPWETPRLVRIPVSSATGRNSLVTSVKVPSATEEHSQALAQGDIFSHWNSPVR